MQLPEMRTFRALYAQKHLFSTRKLSPGPPSLISCKYSQNPLTFHIHRHIHSTIHRRSSDYSASFPKTNGKSPSVSIFVDPITGDVVTQATTSDKEDYSPKSSNSYYSDALQDDNRSYRSVLKAQQRPESNTSAKEDYNPKSTNSYYSDALQGDNRSYCSSLKAQQRPESGSSDKENYSPKLPNSFQDVNGSYSRVFKPQNESNNSREKSVPVTGYSDSRKSFGSYKSNKSQLGGSVHVNNKNKNKKVKKQWVCSECGNSDGQWWGMCPDCKSAGTMNEFSVTDPGAKVSGIEASEKIVKSWFGPQLADDAPVRLTNVNKGMNQSEWRIPLSGPVGNEVAMVLGGGIVPGSLVLIGGDPGVGKSTLVLQMAAMIAEGHGISEEDPVGVDEVEELPPDEGSLLIAEGHGISKEDPVGLVEVEELPPDQESLLNGKTQNIRGPAPVVYVSGEESVEQIKNRADRLDIGTEELYLFSSTDIEDILDKAQRLSPRALVIDSIQTVYLKGVTGSAGSVSQVKECTSALLRFAKKTNIPVLLIGHVTKSGDIAGPHTLEHIVDAVLYLEGESHSAHRLLRPVKNRFGSTDELGVFDMLQGGLQAVLNPSEMYLGEQHSESEVLAGRAVAAVMDGSRTFLIEIQALSVAGSQGTAQVNGVSAGKANMIVAVLSKQAGLKLQGNAIFVNVVSGVTLKETAGDLAIAAAICSSFLEIPIPYGVAFIGEVGLDGMLRMVPRMEKRVMTVGRLGYKKCVVPKSALKSLKGIDLGQLEILGCGSMKDVITVFAKWRI